MVHTEVTFNLRPERQEVYMFSCGGRALETGRLSIEYKLGMFSNWKKVCSLSLYSEPVIKKTLEDKTMNETASWTPRTKGQRHHLDLVILPSKVGWQIDDALYKVILTNFLMLFSQGLCWAFVRSRTVKPFLEHICLVLYLEFIVFTCIFKSTLSVLPF